MELSDQEVAHISHLLDDEGDRMYHHPGDFTPKELADHNTLSVKVRDEAKKRRLWWAR